MKENRPLVYICSPYSGDVEKNAAKARKYCLFAAKDARAIPIAPHLLFTQFLDNSNPDEKRLGMTFGKRDYAMMVLAVQSGLRACDVVRLELGSVDWRTREIHLVQHKTGEPLSLPLEPESGNAIADYILNDRPASTCSNIFLCHSGAVRPLNARSASGIVSKHMKLAGILAKRRGFHAFRRSFGTRLLQSEVSFELIQQLLGHRDMDSMKPYLSIDEQGLKMLPFRCFLRERLVTTDDLRL